MSRVRKRAKKTRAPARGPVLAASAGRAARSHPAGSKDTVLRHTARLREGRYVYGVIESGPPAEFGNSNIEGENEEVYSVHHGAIAAVVSRTQASILDPTRENALAHERVIEAVMKDHTILPMSFGTVFRSDEDVREMLKGLHAPLQEVLRQMKGKVEFGLKVTWDRDRIMEDLKREHQEIHRFHQELARRRLQSTYFARMELGLMIEKALEELAAGYAQEIHDGLRATCVASRQNKPIGDKMIMNAAFLVEKGRTAAFEEALRRVSIKFHDRLTFRFTGPWPPYNFVNIRLKVEQRKAG
jgi:hypothetical protein